jgi:hypothetical protein
MNLFEISFAKIAFASSPRFFSLPTYAFSFFLEAFRYLLSCSPSLYFHPADSSLPSENDCDLPCYSFRKDWLYPGLHDPL